MRKHQWLALLIAAMWLGQAALLWPLPSDDAVKVSASAGGKLASTVDAIEARAWLGWGIRFALILLGGASALMLARKKAKWSIFFLLSAAGYLAWFQPWRAFAVLDLVLPPGSSDQDRASWLMDHPAWVFSVTLFPIFLIVVGLWAAIVAFLHRKHPELLEE